MNSRQIEAFRAVARVGTVTGAAELLSISQPAVSRLIAHLEAQLRMALFARSKGRLQLTPEGLSFLREVDRHFSGLDALAAAAQRIAEHGPESLRIVGFPSITSGALPKALARRLQRHPDAQITLETDTTDRIAPQISAGRFDLGFVAGPMPDTPEVEARIIASRPWVCVAPPSHPLAARAGIEAEELDDAPLVAFSPSMSFRQNVDRLFAARNARPRYRVAAQTIESMCALVAEGCGLAIVHPYATHIARIFGLKTIPVAGGATLDLLALSRTPPFKPRIVDEIVDDVRRIILGEDGAPTAASHDPRPPEAV